MPLPGAAQVRCGGDRHGRRSRAAPAEARGGAQVRPARPRELAPRALPLTATSPGVVTAPGAALAAALAATRAPSTCELRRGAVLASLPCGGRGGQDVSREPSSAPTLGHYAVAANCENTRARARPGSACCRACSRRARCTWATTWAPSATGSTCRTSTARRSRPAPCRPVEFHAFELECHARPPACQPRWLRHRVDPPGKVPRAARRHVLLRRGPARGHAAARPGRAARGDARERGAVPGGRHRPRPCGHLRAVARARARRAGLAAAVLHADWVRGRAAVLCSPRPCAYSVPRAVLWLRKSMRGLTLKVHVQLAAAHDPVRLTLWLTLLVCMCSWLRGMIQWD